jgi:hypothetical protein
MDKISSTYQLPPFREKTQLVNIVIDTPKAAPFKLKFDEKAKGFSRAQSDASRLCFPF